MDPIWLQKTLGDLNLGSIRYFDSLGSTNDEAMRWARSGAPELALVVANEQTAGRGRFGRTWVTVPEASLAFSLVMHPGTLERHVFPRLTALGALAVQKALEEKYSLPAEIKWPNDVLLSRQKVAGVLAEAYWSGGHLEAVVLGIGINIASVSISNLEDQQAFPATYVEAFLDRPVDRWELLHQILVDLIFLSSQLDKPAFMQAWEKSLAFRGEWVQIFRSDGPSQDVPAVAIAEGAILGLTRDGSLKLRDQAGQVAAIRFGELRLRPLPVTSQK